MSGDRPQTLRSLGAISLLVMAVFSVGCGSHPNDGMVTVYSGREEEYIAPLMERYEKETGVEVEIKYGDSAELAATIVEEGENTPAEVFWAQDAGALGAVDDSGLFETLSSDTLSRVPARFRAGDGNWVGTSGRARVVGYDSRELEESDLPESILGFTDPEWKGRIGWAPTNGSFQAFVTALRLVEGEETAKKWLEGIVANDPQSFDDNEAIRDAIAAGEIDVGFLNHYYIAQAQAEDPNYPVSSYFPTDGDAGALINVAGAGELVGGDEEAAAFISFLLSNESQRYFARELKEYPLVPGIESEPELVPLSSIEQPDIDLSDLKDLNGTLDLLRETGAL